MTRTSIGGIAAGAFTFGIVAGLLLPGTLNTSRHDQLMVAHMPAMGSLPMMAMGSMHMSSMPMDMGATSPAGHGTHHASPEVGK